MPGLFNGKAAWPASGIWILAPRHLATPNREDDPPCRAGHPGGSRRGPGDLDERDVVDATRNIRSTLGPVWVVHPQGIMGASPMMTRAGGGARSATSPTKYERPSWPNTSLPGHASKGSRADVYFDDAAQDLLAGMLLAAAIDQRPITDVYVWLTRSTDEEPIEILARHDYPRLSRDGADDDLAVLVPRGSTRGASRG